eukprot:TRINITY_DN81167_c0_g1_i1.p1 TRINITY_DN81167_c0_g1~~TRINITY_DN81167_c0_g1_i1.p1  ORF type:complete len:296 (+),score=99.92 TRINITY_DN81167_c0_g1_i1:75-962(+)
MAPLAAESLLPAALLAGRNLDAVYEEVITKVRQQWEEFDVQDPAHDVNHILAVTDHTRGAIKEESQGEKRDLEVVLAAILHEADDVKLFKSDGSENARKILNAVLGECDEKAAIVDDVINIIDLVSAKKNKHSGVPAGDEWKLLVRDADRIEAIGEIGIARCYAYNQKVGRPLFCPETARPKSEEELWKIATPERFAAYSDSVSMIDHYYDKLLHLQKCGSGSKYLAGQLQKRLQVMVDYCLEFGRKGDVDQKYLEDLKAKWCAPAGSKRKLEEKTADKAIEEPVTKRLMESAGA